MQCRSFVRKFRVRVRIGVTVKVRVRIRVLLVLVHFCTTHTNRVRLSSFKKSHFIRKKKKKKG